jgi:hypothetical protein
MQTSAGIACMQKKGKCQDMNGYFRFIFLKKIVWLYVSMFFFMVPLLSSVISVPRCIIQNICNK